jgi:hypothetical protein
VQALPWWTVPDVLEIGPRHQCFNSGDCIPTGMSWVKGSAQWERFGVATWGAGLVAAMVLVLLAAAIAAGRIPKLLSQMTIVAVLTALVAATIFIAKFPGVPGAELGLGALLYACAMVLGATSAVAMLRHRA